MIVSTLFLQFFRSFLAIFSYILHDPWYLFKISFLWFFVMTTVSYAYFLWTHQGYLLEIRKYLVFLLAKSLLVGLIYAVALAGLYEFLLQMMCASKFFLETKNQICSISLLTSSSKLFHTIAFCEMIFASFWACTYVEPFLKQWYANNIVYGYHWLVILSNFICLSFLFLIIF